MAYNRQHNRAVVLAEVNMILAGIDEAFAERVDAADESYFDWYYGGGEDWEDYKRGRRWSLEERYSEDYPYWNECEQKWEY